MASPEREKGTVEFDNVWCVRNTANAILVRVDGRQVWIPHSQVSLDSEVWKAGQIGTLVITEWIAIQKELV